VLGPSEGLDLNGDGAADNALGVLADPMTESFDDKLQRGLLAILLDFLPPETTGPAPAAIATYAGIDADDIPDNNLDGNGSFLVPAGQLDVSCRPTNTFTATTTGPHEASFSAAIWDIVGQDGTLRTRNLQGSFRARPDGSGGDATVGFVWTLCGTSTHLAQGDGSFLDTLVRVLALQADVDVDGDGLERIEATEDALRCIDGDGTIVPGWDCACHPRIADGYSIALRAGAVRAAILGVEEEP
jgi:hypothetical protein